VQVSQMKVRVRCSVRHLGHVSGSGAGERRRGTSGPRPARERAQPASRRLRDIRGYHGQIGGRKAQRHRPARWRRGAGHGGRIARDDWLSWHGACVRGAMILARWQAPGAGLPDGPGWRWPGPA